MALKLMLEKLEDVTEAQRALYVEKDGKFHLDVDGLEDTTGLKNALASERNNVKEAKRLAKELQDRFEGLDPDKAREIMAKFDQDGEVALIAAGKIDEVIAKRSEKLRAALDKQVNEAKQQTEAEKQRANKFSQRVLDNHIRQAATAAGVHKNAVDDALLRARTMFTLNDDGDAIQLTSDGTPVLGKDGKTPFTPMEWLESMKDTAPHWFPAGNSGGGAGGGKDTKAGGKTITRAAFDSMNHIERSNAAKAMSAGELSIVD
jgi:DNA-directed RNA polymerase subunit F